MAIPYSNNTQIVEFINKAQNKIAQLGAILADEPLNNRSEALLLDLSDFLESLDSIYNNWSELDIIRYIHFWNKRADLNNIPYVQITAYNVSIVLGTGGGSMGDLEASIRDILSRFPHNNLQNLQGGTSRERYHLTKAMYDWVVCQQNKTPCPEVIAPTVTLTKNSNGIIWPSGFYEMGSQVSVSSLQGAINLNSGINISYYRYLRNRIELGKVLAPGTNPISSITDRTTVTQDTSYTFEAEFENGGVKSDVKQISFRQPMYSGILMRNTVSAQTAITLTKNVIERQYMEILFSLPEGNTSVAIGQDFTPIIFIPFSFGIPSSIKVLEYEFKTDWSFTQEIMTLVDGTTQQGYLGVYNKTFEGDTTFKFTF